LMKNLLVAACANYAATMTRRHYSALCCSYGCTHCIWT
jgi:hypothetical protein